MGEKLELSKKERNGVKEVECCLIGPFPEPDQDLQNGIHFELLAVVVGRVWNLRMNC